MHTLLILGGALLATALLTAGLALWFVVGITVQGKMAGGMTKGQAYKAVGVEMLEMLGMGQKPQ